MLHLRRDQMGDLRPSDLLGAIQVFNALFPSTD